MKMKHRSSLFSLQNYIFRSPWIHLRWDFCQLICYFFSFSFSDWFTPILLLYCGSTLFWSFSVLQCCWSTCFSEVLPHHRLLLFCLFTVSPLSHAKMFCPWTFLDPPPEKTSAAGNRSLRPSQTHVIFSSVSSFLDSTSETLLTSRFLKLCMKLDWKCVIAVCTIASHFRRGNQLLQAGNWNLSSQVFGLPWSVTPLGKFFFFLI